MTFLSARYRHPSSTAASAKFLLVLMLLLIVFMSVTQNFIFMTQKLLQLLLLSPLDNFGIEYKFILENILVENHCKINKQELIKRILQCIILYILYK